MKNEKAIALLSGGLDSYCALHKASTQFDIQCALTFCYNQKPLNDEIEASCAISKSLNIENKVISLPYLAQILKDDVWVPNRNGLFINISASFCDYYSAKYIVFGANADEAQDFPDNSIDFINASNSALSYSTKCKAQVYAPFLNSTKYDLVKYAISNDLDFSLIKSCYNATNNGKKHCGKCQSCLHLKNALIKCKREDLFNALGF